MLRKSVVIVLLCTSAFSCAQSPPRPTVSEEKWLDFPMSSRPSKFPQAYAEPSKCSDSDNFTAIFGCEEAMRQLADKSPKESREAVYKTPQYRKLWQQGFERVQAYDRELEAMCRDQAKLDGPPVRSLEDFSSGDWLLVSISCPGGRLTEKGRLYNEDLKEGGVVRGLRLRGQQVATQFTMGQPTPTRSRTHGRTEQLRRALPNGYFMLTDTSAAPEKWLPFYQECASFQEKENGTVLEEVILRPSPYGSHCEPNRALFTYRKFEP